MATAFNEGDRVQVVDRSQNAEDTKSGLFYNHFRGLVGAITKIYPTEEVAVTIEQESLPEDVRKRHLDVQQQMKSRWLDGLSEEARGRLTDEEKDFRLRYSILVKAKDLQNPTSERAPVAQVAAVANTASLPAADAPDGPEAGTPARRTMAEIEADEQAEL